MKRIFNLTLVLLTINTMPTIAAQQAASVMADKEVIFFSLNAIAVLLSIWIASSFFAQACQAIPKRSFAQNPD